MLEKAGRPTAPGADRRTRPTTPAPGDPSALPSLFDERLRFETLLVDLSATFVRVPADQIDTQIEHALGRIVAFLGVDRGTLGEYLEDRRQFLVTHSHEEPGIAPFPRSIVDDQLPWYTAKIRQGEVLRFDRLPKDLPPEAAKEREYVSRVGLKSNLTIPLKVAGSMLGGISFGSFRRYRAWPDELVPRLRLLGEILANALARKRTEEALRQSEERFRRMADSAPVLIWLSGPDKLCTWFNKPWLDFTGRTMAQERGNGWSEGVHPDDFEGCLRTYVTAFDARRPFTMDYRLRRHDGEYRWILDNGMPLYGPGGAFAGYIGSCIDITERKRAASRFQSALEAAPVAMILLDRQGRITLVNTQVERLFGYRREELLGQVIEILIPERFRGRHAGYRESFFAEPRARAMGLGRELAGLRKDGTEVPVEIGLNPVETDSGTFVLASVLDVSERKRAEEQLRASQERQRDLASRLLRAQETERRRVAREMHDNLTQSLAVMAIEVGKLEQQPNLPSPVAEALRRTRDQLVELSEEVHALSRQLHPSILDDLGLVDALRSECAGFEQREGIAVRYQTASVPADLSKDAALCLYRIAQEALRNVARHAGTDRVEVSLIGHDRDVLLTVRDAGKGFELGGARPRLGLGLASMEERARLIGAELSIQSHLGKGTTVTVLAPRYGREP